MSAPSSPGSMPQGSGRLLEPALDSRDTMPRKTNTMPLEVLYLKRASGGGVTLGFLRALKGLPSLGSLCREDRLILLEYIGHALSHDPLFGTLADALEEQRVV